MLRPGPSRRRARLRHRRSRRGTLMPCPPTSRLTRMRLAPPRAFPRMRTCTPPRGGAGTPARASHRATRPRRAEGSRTPAWRTRARHTPSHPQNCPSPGLSASLRASRPPPTGPSFRRDRAGGCRDHRPARPEPVARHQPLVRRQPTRPAGRFAPAERRGRPTGDHRGPACSLGRSQFASHQHAAVGVGFGLCPPLPRPPAPCRAPPSADHPRPREPAQQPPAHPSSAFVAAAAAPIPPASRLPSQTST